jgi:HSP20 family protein
MVLLEKWSPFRDLELLDRQLGWMRKPLRFELDPAPAADVYESDDEIVVELEVPGYEQDELTVEFADHTVAISGHRERKAEDSPRLHERVEADFARRFALPANTDTARMTAMYGKGMLTLHIPKAVRQDAVKVPIERA